MNLGCVIRYVSVGLFIWGLFDCAPLLAFLGATLSIPEGGQKTSEWAACLFISFHPVNFVSNGRI